MLRVLEVALRHHTVATAGRVAAKLEVLLEQLLRGPTDAKVGAVAVEYVVAIERNTAAAAATVVAHATAAAATTAATRSMTAATHTFHVHTVAVTPSRLLVRGGGSFERRAAKPRASRGCAPRPDFTPSALVPAGTLSGGHHSREW